MRIDRHEHVNKIDDEIIAEIRRARFVVADFTHGDTGGRGSVYYEAGICTRPQYPGYIYVQERSYKKDSF